jgi:hypothetical protein
MVIVIPFLSLGSVTLQGVEYGANHALCSQPAFELEDAAKAI